MRPLTHAEPAPEAAQQRAWAEQPVRFGTDGHLIATVLDASRARSASDRTGLVLLNAGLLQRTGPHRINVKIARAAAALGISSIRFDRAGRGDSRFERGTTLPHGGAAEEIGSAMTQLSERVGAARFTLFGICSGADDGLAAALHDERLVSLILFDPYVFPTWGWSLRVKSGKLLKYGFSGSWARFLELRRERRGSDDSALNNYGRDVPPITDYAQVLRTLANRGVAIRLVYSGSSVSEREYRAQCREVLDRHGLRNAIHTEFMPEADHVITSIAAQRKVLDRIPAWLDDSHPTRPPAA